MPKGWRPSIFSLCTRQEACERGNDGMYTTTDTCRGTPRTAGALFAASFVAVKTDGAR